MRQLGIRCCRLLVPDPLDVERPPFTSTGGATISSATSRAPWQIRCPPAPT